MSVTGDRGAERLLARVREALGRGRSGGGAGASAGATAPRVGEDLVRLARAGDDLIGLFSTRAAESGAVVRTAEPARLAAAIAEALEEAGAHDVVVAIEGIVEATALAEETDARGIRITAAADAGSCAVERADASVTGVDAALAETGTLVLHSRPGNERGLSLLPPVHVAVVRESDIVPDLVDAACALAALRRMPSAVTLVTGPSKTADIEGVLVTGVHGPGRLHIILAPGV